MNRHLVREISPFRHLDRIDFADQIRNRNVRRRELLAVALIAAHPIDLEPVALGLDARPARVRDRLERTLVELAAGDNRHPFVEQARQSADHPRLRLAALSEKDDVLSREDCVLELGYHGLFVSVDSVEERLSFADARDQVAAHLFLDGALLVPGLLELPECPWL